MRNLNLADMDARVTMREAQAMTREFLVHLGNAQGAWLDRELKKILPPRIYKMAYDQSGSDEQFVRRQEEVGKYLSRRDIRIVQAAQSTNCALYERTKLLSRFVVKLAEK